MILQINMLKILKTLNNKKTIAAFLAAIVILIIICLLPTDYYYHQITYTPDKSNLIYYNNHIFDSVYPTQEDNINNFCKKISFIQEEILTENNKSFYSIVPDKSYFLKDTKYKTIDYNLLLKITNDKLSNIEYIDIFPYLELNDYFKTDFHWKQNGLFDICELLSSKMKFDFDRNNFQEKRYSDFYGILGNRSKYLFPKEEISLFTSRIFDDTTVDVFQEPNKKFIYDLDKINSKNPYDVFLSGVCGIVKLTTSNNTNKNLIIFRDSYAASLAPLLLESYDTITLIDLRFVPRTQLKEYVNFENQDILFLFSTQIINDILLR